MTTVQTLMASDKAGYPPTLLSSGESSSSEPTPAQRAWAHCKDWIEVSVLERGLEAIQDVEQSIERGASVFWSGESAAGVSGIQDIDGVRNYVLVYSGGDAAELALLIRTHIEADAPFLNCDSVRIEMSKAQAKVLPKLLRHDGYRRRGLTLTKRLESN